MYVLARIWTDTWGSCTDRATNALSLARKSSGLWIDAYRSNGQRVEMQAVSKFYGGMLDQEQDKCIKALGGRAASSSRTDHTIQTATTMYTRFLLCCISFIILLHFLGPSAKANTSKSTLPGLYEATITDLQDGLEQGHFTSVDLVKVTYSPILCDSAH